MVSGVMSTFSAVTVLTALITPGFAAEGACKAGNEPECFAKSGTDGVGMVQRRMNISKHEEGSEIPPAALFSDNYTRVGFTSSKSLGTCAGFDAAMFENTMSMTAVVEIDGTYPKGTLMAFWKLNMACAGLFPNPASPGQSRGWAGFGPPFFGNLPFFSTYAGKPAYGIMVYSNFGDFTPFVFKFKMPDGTVYDLKVTGGGLSPPKQPYHVASGSPEIWMPPNANFGNAVTPIKFSKA